MPLQQDVICLEHEIESAVHATPSIVSREGVTLNAIGCRGYQHPGKALGTLRKHRQMSGGGASANPVFRARQMPARVGLGQCGARRES